MEDPPRPPFHTNFRLCIPILGPTRPTKAFQIYIRPFTLTPRSSTPTKRPSYPSQAPIPILGPHTFPWPCTPTLDPPHLFQALLTHSRPSIPIPDVPYPPKALHTHLKPFPHIRCPSYTHLKFITLISGLSHPPKALHTDLGSFTLISGSPQCTHPKPFTSISGTPCPSSPHTLP